MAKQNASLGIITIMAGSLVACAPEATVEPAIMAQQAAVYLRNTGMQTAAGTGFAGSRDSTLKQLMHSIELVRADLGDALPSPLPSPLLGVLGDSTFVKALLDPKSRTDLGATLNDTSVHLERWVRDRLLAQANLLEQPSDDTAIYQLKADPTCRPLVAPGAPAPELDQDCARELERIQVRVYMKAILDGVNLRFVVGPDELEFSTFVIRLDGLEWRADLAKANTAKRFVDATLGLGDKPEGTKAPAASQFSKLAGKIVLAVKKDGNSGVTVSLSITGPVEIVRATGDKPSTVLKTSSAMLPVLVITGDGAKQILSLQLDLGPSEFLTAWDPQNKGNVNTDHRIAFDGLTARGRLLEKERELRLTDVGLAGYHEQVRGKTTMSVAVNPADGGKFDVTATLDENNGAHFEIGPRLELVANLEMAALAGDYDASAKPYLPEETIRLVLGGTGGPVKLSILTQRGVFAAVKVAGGSFELSSTKAQQPLIAAPGSCVTRAKSIATGAHPLIGKLAVVACP